MPVAPTVTQTITWYNGKKPVPPEMQNQRLIIWIYRPGLAKLSTRTGRYVPGKGWVIDNTDNATVYWYTRLVPPQEQP